MADKPRVKAPKQRASTAGESASSPHVGDRGRRRRRSSSGSSSSRRALGFVGGERRRRPTRRGCGRRSRMPGARCRSRRRSRASTRSRTPARRRRSGTRIRRRAGRTTRVPAVFGIYEDELEIARVVHNLEHGGIYILYGKDVPDATVEQLRSFYEDHKTGHDHGAARPARRQVRPRRVGRRRRHAHRTSSRSARAFDENAVSTFFRSLQFRGPERFDPSQLQPGM